MKAYRGRRGKVTHTSYLGIRWYEWSVPRLSRLSPGKWTPVPRGDVVTDGDRWIITVWHVELVIVGYYKLRNGFYVLKVSTLQCCMVAGYMQKNQIQTSWTWTLPVCHRVVILNIKQIFTITRRCWNMCTYFCDMQNTLPRHYYSPLIIQKGLCSLGFCWTRGKELTDLGMIRYRFVLVTTGILMKTC
jgi:hypothetical protein